MRVIFSTSDPLKTLNDLRTCISYKTFIRYLEMLDAKATIEEDAQLRAARNAKQESERGNKK